MRFATSCLFQKLRLFPLHYRYSVRIEPLCEFRPGNLDTVGLERFSDRFFVGGDGFQEHAGAGLGGQLGGWAWWSGPGGGEEEEFRVDAAAPEHFGIVVEELAVLVAELGLERLFLHEQEEVAEKDTFEEAAIAAPLIPQDAVAAVERAPAGDGEGGRFFRVSQVARLTGDLVELEGGAEEGSLIVAERDAGFAFCPFVIVVGDGAGLRVKEMVFFPLIDFLGPFKFFFIAADLIEPAGEDTARAVGAGVFAPEMVCFPGEAAVFGVPRFLDVLPELAGAFQVSRFAGGFMEAQEGEGDPLHVVEEDIPVAVSVFFADAVVPWFEVVAVFGVFGAEPGIDNHIHGMGLRPVVEACGAAVFVIEVVAGAVPELFEERAGGFIGGLCPVGFGGLFFRSGRIDRIGRGGCSSCIGRSGYFWLPGFCIDQGDEEKEGTEAQCSGCREVNELKTAFHTGPECSLVAKIKQPRKTYREAARDKRWKTVLEFLDMRVGEE